MKTIQQPLKRLLSLMGLLLLWVYGKPQDTTEHHTNTVTISLNQAVTMARAGNKSLQRAAQQQHMTYDRIGIEKDNQTPERSAGIERIAEHFNNISERINAQMKYYQLFYTIGTLQATPAMSSLKPE
ncbi:hypothetical protein [Filimonas lacunae]|nr:hypothetical protein [Filimonas lacunae]BAV04587.1 hypothetical protein FLA_0579 [Filimonas lacunae]